MWMGGRAGVLREGAWADVRAVLGGRLQSGRTGGRVDRRTGEWSDWWADDLVNRR